jgi:hypothetical protein
MPGCGNDQVVLRASARPLLKGSLDVPNRRGDFLMGRDIAKQMRNSRKALLKRALFNASIRPMSHSEASMLHVTMVRK